MVSLCVGLELGESEAQHLPVWQFAGHSPILPDIEGTHV
jgi:hypothetical protein